MEGVGEVGAELEVGVIKLVVEIYSVLVDGLTIVLAGDVNIAITRQSKKIASIRLVMLHTSLSQQKVERLGGVENNHSWKRVMEVNKRVKGRDPFKDT